MWTYRAPQHHFHNRHHHRHCLSLASSALCGAFGFDVSTTLFILLLSRWRILYPRLGTVYVRALTIIHTVAGICNPYVRDYHFLNISSVSWFALTPIRNEFRSVVENCYGSCLFQIGRSLVNPDVYKCALDCYEYILDLALCGKLCGHFWCIAAVIFNIRTILYKRILWFRG